MKILLTTLITLLLITPVKADLLGDFIDYVSNAQIRSKVTNEKQSPLKDLYPVPEKPSYVLFGENSVILNWTSTESITPVGYNLYVQLPKSGFRKLNTNPITDFDYQHNIDLNKYEFINYKLSAIYSVGERFSEVVTVKQTQNSLLHHASLPVNAIVVKKQCNTPEIKENTSNEHTIAFDGL